MEIKSFANIIPNKKFQVGRAKRKYKLIKIVSNNAGEYEKEHVLVKLADIPAISLSDVHAHFFDPKNYIDFYEKRHFSFLLSRKFHRVVVEMEIIEQF